MHGIPVKNTDFRAFPMPFGGATGAIPQIVLHGSISPDPPPFAMFTLNHLLVSHQTATVIKQTPKTSVR